MKRKIALLRGKFLNKYEMQFFEPLVASWDITAFGSWTPYHKQFAFPVITLPSPMDLPEFPKKMAILNRIFTDAQYLYGLEKSLEGFDLVHSAETYYRYTQQALDAKRRGIVKKVIATVLENIPFANEGIWGRRAYKKRSREELDHIIALTERTKVALMLEGVDEKKITVISHFVDTDRFCSASKRSPSDTFTILYCGRLETYKGVYELMYALRLLLSDKECARYTIQLCMVGEGSQKKGLLALEERLGVGRHVRHVSIGYEKMPDMYQTADLYVAPSVSTETWQEQYNTTLLEAQACALPIVTTWSGGISENVGDAAVLVQPADVLSLFTAIKEFIMNENKRVEYSRRARTRAITVHDKSIGARKIAEVYTKVLAH